MKRMTLGILIACALVLVVVENVSAQGISIGYGRGWGGRGSGVSVGYYSPNFAIQYGQPGYGYGYGRYGVPGYGYGGYNRPYYGGLNYSTPYYGTRGYARPYYSGGWYYPGTSYNTPGMWDAASQRYVTSSSMPSGYQSGYYSPPQGNNQVLLQVRVPAPNAQVWVENTPTDQMGTHRLFVSPPLEQGTYTYTVRASWMENGREVSQERKVSVTPGQNALADFLPERSALTDVPLTTPSGARPPATGTPIAGKVVRVEDERIVIALTDGGDNRTYRVLNDTNVMINGEKADLKALQPGMQISVTTRAGSTDMATRLEATRPNPDRRDPQIPPE